MKRRKGGHSIIRKHMFRYLKHPEQMLVASGIFMDEMQSYGYRCVVRKSRVLSRLCVEKDQEMNPVGFIS